MRSLLTGACALLFSLCAVAQSTISGEMVISYGYFTDAEGRKISLEGRKVPVTIEAIPLGVLPTRPPAQFGTDLETVYENDHGPGSYIASGIPMPSALDDIIMVNGANSIWQFFTFGINANTTSTSGEVFIRWTGYKTFTPGLGGGVMAFTNPAMDFGGPLSLALLNAIAPLPNTYKITINVSGFGLSSTQNALYFAQQFRNGNENGPFRTEFDNVFSRGFPNPGSSQESFYFDFEPDGIFDETEIDVWEAGNEANMLLKIEANPSGVVETRVPSSFTYVPGTPVSGEVSDLWDSDNFYLVAGPGIVFNTSQPPLRIELVSTSTTTLPTAVAMHIENKGTAANVQQQLEFWNYSTSAWVLADTRNVTTTESVMEVVAPGTASHYVHQTSRQMRTRLSYKAQGPVFLYPWRISWDQAIWRVTRP
ncbi:MAG: hypothetical protein ABIV13_01015 [Fimbriimonadales bacterium]